MKYDFVIVGAGVGGLYLAYLLEKKGVSYVILEANSRHGGRIQTVFRDHATFELGAARLLSSHTLALELVHSFNIELEEMVIDDAAVHWDGNWNSSLNELLSAEDYPDPMDLFSDFLRQHEIGSVEEFERLAPKTWDTLYTKDWLAELGVPASYAKRYFLGDIDVELQQISLYESLYFYLSNLAHPEAKIFRTKGGLTQLADALAHQVNDPIYQEKVIGIYPTEQGLEVLTHSRTYFAQRVVCTCSLTALGNIELPIEAKTRVQEWLQVGHYGKSVKGIVHLSKAVFPNHNYLLTEDPIRLLRRSQELWELYLPSLNKRWTPQTLQDRLRALFKHDQVALVYFQDYDVAPFYGCYWNYSFGGFHRIFEAGSTFELTPGIVSVGEHFSMNPNWIEGTLVSVSNYSKTIQ